MKLNEAASIRPGMALSEYDAAFSVPGDQFNKSIVASRIIIFRHFKCPANHVLAALAIS